jgi:uncharacterized membrane protein YfcA
MTISLILGILVGAVLGLTGAGGGILAVPALATGMGWSMQQAAPVALLAVAGSAAIGALEGFRHNLVRYRAAIWMAIAGLPFTMLGGELAHVLSQRILIFLFSLVMLFVAYRFFARSQHHEPSHENAIRTSKVGRLNPETGRFDWSLATALLVGAIGAVTGFMTGLLGVGGGFVIVPMLRRYTNVSMHGIVATSLFVIALVGSGGVLTAVLRGVALPLQVCLFFSIATAAGMMIGRYLSGLLPPHRIQQGFATVLLVVALMLLAKATMGSV